MNPWYYFWIFLAVAAVPLTVLTILTIKLPSHNKDRHLGWWFILVIVMIVGVIATATSAWNLDKNMKIAQISSTSGLDIDKINQGQAKVSCHGLNSHFQLWIPYTKVDGVRTLFTYVDRNRVPITYDNINDYFIIPCEVARS
jgi:Na+/melibiose symporter-like transporter